MCILISLLLPGIYLGFVIRFMSESYEGYDTVFKEQS